MVHHHHPGPRRYHLQLTKSSTESRCFLLKFASFVMFPDDPEGVRGDHGEQGGDPHQDHHGQLHHSSIWGDGDYFNYNFHNFVD